MKQFLEIGPTGIIAHEAGFGDTDIARTAVPAANEKGYAHGCICRKLNGTGTSDAIYINTGTWAAANFQSLNAIAAALLSATNLELASPNDIEISPTGVSDAIYVHATAGSGTNAPDVVLSGNIGTAPDGIGGNVTLRGGEGAVSGAAAIGGCVKLRPGGGGADSGVPGSVILDGSGGGATLFSPAATPTANVATTFSPTAANLLAGRLTSTQAGAVTLNLPVGTAMDAAVSAAVIGVDMEFEWRVINLGSASGAATVTASTGHTIVGNAVVAITTTGVFRSRRTAANTWVTYRNN